MGDRIAVMRAGVLQQAGSPEELYTQPVNLFVARFIGSPAMNLVPVETASENRADTARLAAVVSVVEYLGDEQLVHLRAGDVDLVAKLPVEPRLSPGTGVEMSVPLEKVYLFDRESEQALAPAV